LERLKVKEAILQTFDKKFVKELEQFMIYDDYGKGKRYEK
jgi:hypothetical protein